MLLQGGAAGATGPGGSTGAGAGPSSSGEVDKETAALERLQAELIAGWTVHIGREGRLYYCNHVTRTAGWLPPAEWWTGDEGGGESAGVAGAGGDLPYGWEEAMDNKIKHYFINHVNKTTTYVAPASGAREPPPAPREVRLRRHAELGFGFVAGSERPVVVRFVTENGPSVGKLEPGDEILAVNGEDVRSAPRDHVIRLVRACEREVVVLACQPAARAPPGRKSTLLSKGKRDKLRANPTRVRFAESVCVNGSPIFPPSAFSLGDLCLPPMANVLKVFLENGQTKSFKYDTTTMVQDVLTSLKDKLCITAGEHFSLVVEHVKSLRRNKLTLLDPKESLARIASRPGAHKMRCLFRVSFVPTSAAELAQKDLSALDYLYLQSCNDVLQERFAPELQADVALRLAALHMHQHAADNNVPTAKLTVKTVEREFGLERFVPSSLLDTMKRKELRRLLAHFLKLNSQMTGNQNKQLTQLQAKLHYLDIISGLPSYGAKCFSSNQPERVLLVSPRFGLSQIGGVRNSVPQPIATIDELVGVRLEREDELSYTVSIFLQRERALAFSMEDRDGAELALVLAGYYCLMTGSELNVDLEREPITEDIAPPYLSQHNVVPARWSYINYDEPNLLERPHYAVFSMPPPYRAQPAPHTPHKLGLDTNMNSSITNRNHSSNNSSPLVGYDRDNTAGVLGYDIHFEKCKRTEEFRLFDNTDMLWFDDGMGFDLQSVLSMELLENASDNPRLIEARNEEVLKRVAEMQKLVENSEQYLTEQGELVYRDNASSNSGNEMKETNVDPLESDNESNHSRMSSSDDTPGKLKHSDSLLLLTETINQGLNGLGIGGDNNDKNTAESPNNRHSQGLSAILNNCGLTDALIALNNDLSQSESDNESLYTPTNSPIHRHQSRTVANKTKRTSFGLHSPDNVGYAADSREQNLKEYLKQLRENTNSCNTELPDVEVTSSYGSHYDDLNEMDAEIIDLRLIPPPQTPDELDGPSQVPQILPVVPSSFADENKSEDVCDGVNYKNKSTELDSFLATVTVQPPTVKVTPAVELTPEEIMSYIIPPPPRSNKSTLDRNPAIYSNNAEIVREKVNSSIDDHSKVGKKVNGEVVKGTLSVSEIRNMFTSKNLSDARNSLLLNEKNKSNNNCKNSDSPNSKRRNSFSSAKSASHVIEYPTVERKGVFSCCSKENKNKSSENTETSRKSENFDHRSDTIPDVCEIRPPPRLRNGDGCKPPTRPPKTVPMTPSRPRSSSFSCPQSDLSLVDITKDHFSTLNNRKLNYQTVCDINEHTFNYSYPMQEPKKEMIPPQLPPRYETKTGVPPPPHVLLPPKKPPLPPVPSIDVLRMKNNQKNTQTVNRPEQRHASIGSPHFQRNPNTYRNLENEQKINFEEANHAQSNGHVRTLSQPQCFMHNNSMTLQNRHSRSNSETKNSLLKNSEMSAVFSLCSPQLNRKFQSKPDLLNGAPLNTDLRIFSPNGMERKNSLKGFQENGSPIMKPNNNHVRFREETANAGNMTLSPSMSRKVVEAGSGTNGHVISVEALLVKTDAAVEGLLQRLHLVAQKCSHQHAHGGGEHIDDAKFQSTREELTLEAVGLVGASRALVGALASPAPSSPTHAASSLAACVAPLRRLAELSQALGVHTSSPLQTRNLVLRVYDVMSAFRELAGAEMAQIFREHNAKKALNQDATSSLEGQLALRAECLANVLATLLRSLRVFSP